MLYDTISKRRINDSGSIFIGDYVWISQNVLLLKGTKIGSGGIVGGHSVVSNKPLSSNVSYAGNPVRKIRDHVFFFERICSLF